MKPDEAERRIREGEGQHTEFKTGFAEDNDAIESLCAFANAEGGSAFLGVCDDGTVIGVDLGQNTLVGFAGKLRRESDPPLSPAIEQLQLQGRTVVVATVEKAVTGSVCFAFNHAFVRVGNSNHKMTPAEIRSRLMAGVAGWSEERDRPAFEVLDGSTTIIEDRFEPSRRLEQVSGEYVSGLEWRFRGPRFEMEWRQAAGGALARTNISGVFDLTEEPGEDDRVGLDELGLEIRFHWRGAWRHELHRWPVNRRVFPEKVFWNPGLEILPLLTWDE